MRFIAPSKLLIPDRCKANIAKFTPAPFSVLVANTNNIKLGTSSQKLILFSLGNAISESPTKSEINKLPSPPIIAGITIKKMISNACALIIPV